MQKQKQKAQGANNSCSEKKPPPATLKSTRQLKISSSDSDSVISSSSSITPSKTPKERSPKVAERKSPRTPASEKKRSVRVSDLESQIGQLLEDLKKVKEQLTSSESRRRQAQHEAEEAKKSLSLMAEKLEDSEQQLMDVSASEDSRVQELRKLSQERDRAWQSELEAVQRQKAMDSAALASAMNEIKKLRVQLERMAESEATQSKHAESAHSDAHTLRMELSETLNLVETLRNELSDFRLESEAAQAVMEEEVVRNTEKQLEIANVTADTLRSECIKTMEAYNSVAAELERSKDQIKELEESNQWSNIQESNCGGGTDIVVEEELRDELDSVKLEASKLRSALEVAETRYQEEYIQSTLQIRSAYEQVEQVKQESCQRQAALEEELKVAKELSEKEISQLVAEMERLRVDLSELKESLRDKEGKLKRLSEENQAMKKEETNSNGEEAARAAEMKLAGLLTEEAEESSKRATRITQQLDEAQAANSEMEYELRRLKVQSEQWRKAAEVAASMLSTTGSHGKLVERTGSVDNYYSSVTGNMGSPNYSEDMEEESSPKKKNGTMLKKIGVLWKKGQNK